MSKVSLDNLARQKPTVRRKNERWGIFAMDPGTTTGLCWTEGPILPGQSPGDAFREAGWGVAQVIHAEEMDSAVVISAKYEAWYQAGVRQGIPGANLLFVYEDFILRAGKMHSSHRAGLSPVRITALVQGLLFGMAPVYVAQQPGDAKGRWTNERLRRADLWTKGMEHARDATRHAALAYVRRVQ